MGRRMIVNMWNIDPKKIYGFNWLDQSMMTSSLAFPRLPPSASHPHSLSKTGRLKEDIIRDNASMLAKLFDFHNSFQQYASGLFDLVPSNQFVPGHPLHSKMNSVATLETENEKLRKENAVLKQDLEKHKKK